MKKIIFVLVCLISFSSFAEEKSEYLRYHPFSGHFGLGAAFGPNVFYMNGNAEYHVDQFFSFGPMMQAGFKEGFTAVIPTANARLTFPIFPTDRLEISVHGGLGFMYRNTSGTQLTHFDFVTGANFDVYIIKNLTLGVGGNWNVTSSGVQRTFGALYGEVACRF